MPAYLFTGQGLNDKWRIAREIACYLNCLHPDKEVCGTCSIISANSQANSLALCLNCRWIVNDEHPQALRRLSGAGSKSGKIAVEKARELWQELAKMSQYYRVVVVEEADQEVFHRPSANALLKTIEEPKQSHLIILFAVNASEVLPTIVSRCQVLEIRGGSNKNTGSPTENDPKAHDKILSQTLHNRLGQMFEEFSTGQKGRGASRAKPMIFADKLLDVFDEEGEFEEIIDLLAAWELKRIDLKGSVQPETIAYAQRLISLCEMTKTLKKHFVSKKAVTETFVFAWHKLQAEHGRNSKVEEVGQGVVADWPNR
jgi:hypothetical protein